jgi:hypothetical protein
VHGFEADPEKDVDRQRPPTKTKMSTRIIHSVGERLGGRRISTDCGDCTDVVTNVVVTRPLFGVHRLVR